MNCSESCLCGSEISSWLLAEVVLRNDEEEKEIEGFVFVMLISKFFDGAEGQLHLHGSGLVAWQIEGGITF